MTTDIKLSGWKVLTVDKTGLLSSPSMNHDWRPKQPFEAHCGYAHDLRDRTFEQCTCGVYTVKNINDCKSYLPHERGFHPTTGNDIVGAFVECSLWGWVIEGTQGFRSQFAYPRMILAPHGSNSFFDLVRDMYEVPVVYTDEVFELKKSGKLITHEIVDTSKYTADQIRRALRQSHRHKLYMQIRNLEKTLASYEDELNVRLPARIKEMKSRIRRIKEERESL